MTTRIDIPLAGLSTARQVLARIGEALQLGGPDGNHTVRPGEESGWGMNWDALFDCMLNLRTGGIWGTSPVPAFPLQLWFTGTAGFRQEAPHAFAILQDILEQSRATYARKAARFAFELLP